MDIVDNDLVTGMCSVVKDGVDDEGGHLQLTSTHDDTSDEQDAAIASVTSGGITLDSTIQYQLRADNNDQGQVTYRVVQVADTGEATAQVLSGSLTGNHVTVIQSPFSTNGGSPAQDQNDSRFAYFPASANIDGTVLPSQGDAVASAASTLGQVVGGGGQFYVMMSPQDVLQTTQRNIAPRNSFSPKLESGRPSRDDRRRATHNEVERRRRDKINNWIVQLSNLVPDCAREPIKQTQASKGGILAKACDYIQELRSINARLMGSAERADHSSVDVDMLTNQMLLLKKQNSLLRSFILQKGLQIPAELLTDGLL